MGPRITTRREAKKRSKIRLRQVTSHPVEMRTPDVRRTRPDCNRGKPLAKRLEKRLARRLATQFRNCVAKVFAKTLGREGGNVRTLRDRPSASAHDRGGRRALNICPRLRLLSQNKRSAHTGSQNAGLDVEVRPVVEARASLMVLRGFDEELPNLLTCCHGVLDRLST